MAKIVSYHKACAELLLRPSIHCIPSHNLQHCDKALASSIFGLQAHRFSRYLNNLLINCCDASDKLCPDDFWDVREVLVVQDTFHILQVGIAWRLNFNLLSLVILILEFMQPQPYQADIGLIRSFICQLIPKQFPKLA